MKRINITKDRKEKMEALLAEGYKNELAEDIMINKEWEDLTINNWPE